MGGRVENVADNSAAGDGCGQTVVDATPPSRMAVDAFEFHIPGVGPRVRALLATHLEPQVQHPVAL